MAIEAAQPRAAEKNQKIETTIDPSVGVVFGDVRRLRESIEHVLNNALAYTDKRGRIRVRASGDADQAIIEIADNGMGISEEDLPRVFDRFHRIDEAGVRGEAALGLGLPLTRQFIEAHGGTVELRSVKDKGTTVALTIPRGAKP
jgi:signal transduction histidine kinase